MRISSLKLGAGCVVICLLLAAGCGGGDGAAAPTPIGSGTTSPPPPAPAPTPAINSSPVVLREPSEFQALAGHAFSFDLTLDGAIVKDADNDPLTYEPRAIACTDGVLQGAAGLVLSGTVLSGTPGSGGYCELYVDAKDNFPGNAWASFKVLIRIKSNSDPVLTRAIAPLLVNDSGSVAYDVTQGGATFTEPDGDAMTYEISLRGNSQGLFVSGTRVMGSFPLVGAVDVKVTARDAYGGASSQSFLIARPAQVTAEPRLAAPPFLYRDEDLVLPFVFRVSSDGSARVLFDSQPPDNRSTNAGSALGRVLFYDRRLSLTNAISCSSCHERARGFATSRRFDVGITGISMKRNSMALANSRYTAAWFWDMRSHAAGATSLKDVVLHPLQDHDELGMSPDLLITKLAATSYYPRLFADAFGTSEITLDRIGRALGQFVQSLISYRSKADQAFNSFENGPGDPASVYTAQELRGSELFSNECSICHEPNAHTNVWQANNGLDEVAADPGITDRSLNRGSRGAFRAPSLRNIAVSAPYMHDGRFSTLREVIDHYSSGIQASADLDPILRRLDGPTRLNLSDADKGALDAFLQTLTDHEFLADPKFSDPFQ